MKLTKVLTIIFLTFSFYNIVKAADDIKDFQIEGMSIGDSLLEFFNEKIINKDKAFYNSNKFYQVSIDERKFNLYESVNFQLKSNDKNYIIHSLSGVITLDIKKCLKDQKIILNDIKSLFTNTEIYDAGKRKHPAYENSFTYDIYVMVNNDMISVSCYEMNESDFNDTMLVSVDTAEFNNFLNNEAHK